jgi:hypothetical protein
MQHEVSIEIYSDIHKNSVAVLILSIQNGEFEIPITIEQQRDQCGIFILKLFNRAYFDFRYIAGKECNI